MCSWKCFKDLFNDSCFQPVDHGPRVSWTARNLAPNTSVDDSAMSHCQKVGHACK